MLKRNRGPSLNIELKEDRFNGSQEKLSMNTNVLWPGREFFIFQNLQQNSPFDCSDF